MIWAITCGSRRKFCPKRLRGAYTDSFRPPCLHGVSAPFPPLPGSRLPGSRVGPAGTREFERGAVIDGGADDRQPERDIDRLAEAHMS